MMIPDCSISYLSSVRSCVATACSFQSSILLPLPLPLTGPPQSSQMSLRLRQRSAVHGPSAPRPIPPCFPTSWTSWSPLRDSQCWLRPLHRARVHHTAHRTVYHSLAQQLGKKKGGTLHDLAAVHQPQEVSAQDMICRAADSVHSEPRWNCSASSIGCPHLLSWKTLKNTTTSFHRFNIGKPL